jgi:hypothetical protein
MVRYRTIHRQLTATAVDAEEMKTACVPILGKGGCAVGTSRPDIAYSGHVTRQRLETANKSPPRAQARTGQTGTSRARIPPYLNGKGQQPEDKPTESRRGANTNNGLALGWLASG